jgi:hypothetical protein
VGYHWFFPDGIEALWRPPITVVIDREVEPGRSVNVNVPVRAPERDGEYVLAFDALRAGGGDAWLSAQPLTGNTADLALSRVRVTGGGLVYADLSKVFNVDAIAPASAPTDGDLDGAGRDPARRRLPARPVRPARRRAIRSRAGRRGKEEGGQHPRACLSVRLITRTCRRPARRIGFRYGPKAAGAKNAVSCEARALLSQRPATPA